MKGGGGYGHPHSWKPEPAPEVPTWCGNGTASWHLCGNHKVTVTQVASGSLWGAVASVEERSITRAPKGFHAAARGGIPRAGFRLPLRWNPSQALPILPEGFEI